ncbi:hypothetical protein HG537_0G02450 [Torulaspora globosa]|uniref:DASH complex subunit DAD2 n=1 Tax=Torulaspora globosa TaxID=48254 RepID=A0A7H9HXC1_9SACH|nr:hypothetical protein HG537_0G02450 [Torulaspora sp. CBS 2947]
MIKLIKDPLKSYWKSSEAHCGGLMPLGMSMESQIALKKRELEALKRITSLTDEMKVQLDGLAEQVCQMESNAETVSEVMRNWNSIMRSISQASLSLLQYAEGDYEVGAWAPETGENDGSQGREPTRTTPLPETLVRIRVDETEN